MKKYTIILVTNFIEIYKKFLIILNVWKKLTFENFFDKFWFNKYDKFIILKILIFKKL